MNIYIYKINFILLIIKIKEAEAKVAISRPGFATYLIINSIVLH